jgi:hypothetical protein
MSDYFTKHYFSIVGVCFLSGCVFQDQGIENKALRDRVVACGAGFSDSALGSLGTAYAAYPFDAQANAGFKASAEEIIFAELPLQDRLKAYKAYILCIESHNFSNDMKDTK